MMSRNIMIFFLTGWMLTGCTSREEVHPVGQFFPVSDRFRDVIPEETLVERMGIGFEFTEGPVWHPDGYLVFSDIPASIIYRWNGKKYDTFRQPSGHSNGLLFEPDGSLLACEHGSRSITRYSPEGESEVLVDSYRGKKLNSPNDLCRSSDGSLFFTDPPWGLEGRNDDPEKELPFNGVFRWQRGRLKLVDSTLSGPNGIALSPDEHYLYVANMETGMVDGEMVNQMQWLRYTLGGDGKVVARDLFFSIVDPSLPGSPDGMKVDRNGNLFLTGPGGILVVDKAGTLLGTIGIPIPATNLAFGPREREIYVTARSTLYRVRLK